MPKAETKTNDTPNTQADVNALTNPLQSHEIDESILERRQDERAQKLKAIRFLSMPTMKSKDLCGVSFDIIDAVKQRINDEDSISFVLQLTSGDKSGQIFKVNKAKNLFTEAYLDYFESFRDGEQIEPMRNYTFVELSDGGKAGNLPITLRAL